MLSFFQLRDTIFNFAQKELAPKAAEIDKTNNFNGLRVKALSNIRTLCV